MRKSTFSKPLLWAGMLGLALGACSQKKATTTSEEAGSTSVTFQGSLSLAGDTGASLTADTFQIYCVTFELPPAPGFIDIDAEGVFDSSLDNFAGKSFGCFLMVNDLLKGSLTFDNSALGIGGSTLAVGAGTVKLSILYDSVTGTVTATVVSVPSDKTVAVATKDIPDMTGNWGLSCDTEKAASDDKGSEKGQYVCMEDAEGNKLADSDEGGMKFFLHHQVDDNYMGLWESKAAYEACIKGGNEFQPTLAYNIGDTAYNIDFSSVDKFRESIDVVYEGLPAALKTALFDAMSAQEENRYGWCDSMGSKYTESKCKIVTQPEPTCETKKGFDPNTNEPKDYTFCYGGGHYQTFAEVEANAYSGATSSSTEKCRYFDDEQLKKIHGADESWREVHMGCSDPKARENDADKDGIGEMTVLSSDTNKTLFLACEVSDGDQGTRIEMFPTQSANVADALADRKPPGQDQCEDATGTYAGLKAGSVDELRRTVLELFRNEGKGGGEEGDECSRYEIPANFTFNSCNQGGDNQLAVCWGSAEHMGLQVDSGTGKLKVQAGFNQDHPMFPQEMADTFCPNHAAALQNFQQTESQRRANVLACMNEFAGKTAVQQAQWMNEMQLNWQVVTKLACSSSTSDEIKALIADAKQNSCAAQVKYDMMYFNGAVETSLACDGSPTGECFNDDGEFIGRLTGRMEVFKVEPTPKGFNMSASNQNIWRHWKPAEKDSGGSQSKERVIECKNSHSMFMGDGELVSDNEYHTLFKEDETQVCKDMDTGEAAEGDEFDRRERGDFYFPMIFTRLD